MLCVLISLLEGILAQDPHVLSAVMFGRGRFQNGVLIDPKPEFAFDPKDEAKQHSRLFKEARTSIRIRI